MQIELDALETGVDASNPIARRRWPWLLFTVVIVLAACFAIAFIFAGKSETVPVLVHTVQRGDFVWVITETGDLESASNEEVRCEVKSVGAGAGTTILKIVEEGATVKGPHQVQLKGDETPQKLAEKYQVTVKALRTANSDLEAAIKDRKTIAIPGQFLVQFDDAALQQALTQQEIQVAVDEASGIEAQSELDKAVLTLKEYKDGLLLVNKETFEGELLQAESQFKRAQDSTEHAQRMFRRGYVSRLQFEAQREAAETARKTMQVARLKLKVHQEFTRERMVQEYVAEIKIREAYLTAAQKTLKLSQQRRDDVVEQISKCQVEAPSDGLVVYANDSRKQIVIEDGAQIREGQVVIRLPDPKKMQVNTKINDSKINKVSVHCRAEIVLDIDPDLQIHGELIKVNQFPFPRRWNGAPMEYGALIRVIDPPASLRPGQRAKVKIYIDRKENVLQTVVQSVTVRNNLHFCLVKGGGKTWSVRQVSIGPNNDRFVVIKSGLNEGDQVAINPDSLWDDVAGDVLDVGQNGELASLNSR